MCFARSEHILRNFHVLDLIEIFFFASDFVGISKTRPHQTLSKGSKAMMCSRLLVARQHNAADRDHIPVLMVDDPEQIKRVQERAGHDASARTK